MKREKSMIATAVATAVAISQPTIARADTIEFNFSGLFTALSGSIPVKNTSEPYYSDPTWGYGIRTPISGTLSYDTHSGTGSSTINNFNFFEDNKAVDITDFYLKDAGNGLLIGNFNYNWNGNDTTQQIILDASGLFSELASGPSVGDIYDLSTCSTNGDCATPASNDYKKSAYSIGPAPIATTTLNTSGQTGFGTTISQLSLGTDDGIGGSPADNGNFPDSQVNFDFTSLEVTSISSVPIPAAAWLFSSGLLGLIGVARRNKISP